QPTADGYSLFPTLMSIWSGTFKLIISCQGDRVELYDLEKDDQEAVNLATEKKDVVKSLRQKLIVELEKQTTEAKFSCKFNH
ncbi:MAG TPA: hypothetical protein VFY83_02625, partial [Anaerolineales bacterium]|nr:hypothetical protein [Anaerolineales bacterium]